MPQTIISRAGLCAYCLPLAYSLFFASLALEWHVNEARTLALLVSLPCLYFNPDIRQKLFCSTQFRITACFPIIALAAWVISPYANNGFKTLDWIICLSIGYIASAYLNRKAMLLMLALPLTCIAGSAATALYELYTAGSLDALFTNGFKLRMYNESPNRYGLTTAFSAAVVIGVFPLAARREKFILAAMLAILTLLCWYSQSRAAVFGLTGTVCLATLLFLKHSPRQGLLILMVVSIILAIGTILGGERITDTIANRSWEFLLNGREDIWRAAWEIFQKSPLVGFGVNSFRQSLEALLNLPENVARFPDIRAQYIFWNAHQIILGILVETGLAGLIVFIALSARTLYTGVKKYPLALAPLLIFILYWIHGLGGYGFHRSWNSAFFFLAIGLIDGITLPAGQRAAAAHSATPAKGALLKI